MDAISLSTSAEEGANCRLEDAMVGGLAGEQHPGHAVHPDRQGQSRVRYVCTGLFDAHIGIRAPEEVHLSPAISAKKVDQMMGQHPKQGHNKTGYVSQ